MVAAKYTACVYRATNLVNGKIYIGKSILGIHRRMMSHFSAARLGAKQPFICALRKYGKDQFVWDEIFLGADDREIVAAEISLISDYRAAGFILYNLTDGGDGAAGRKITDKMRARMTGPRSEAHKDAMRAAQTPEIRQAKSKRMREREVTAESRLKMREGRLGMKFTAEHCAAISASKIGKNAAKWTAERRAKMEAAWARGACKKSEETKLAISKAKKKEYAENPDRRLACAKHGRQGADKRWGYSSDD